MKRKILRFLEFIWNHLAPLVVANSGLYLVGCVIAWDTNPMNWLLLTRTFGRVVLVAFEVIVLFFWNWEKE